jgi:hypothetical protein
MSGWNGEWLDERAFGAVIHPGCHWETRSNTVRWALRLYRAYPADCRSTVGAPQPDRSPGTADPVGPNALRQGQAERLQCSPAVLVVFKGCLRVRAVSKPSSRRAATTHVLICKAGLVPRVQGVPVTA